jgi:hypothetical protein
MSSIVFRPQLRSRARRSSTRFGPRANAVAAEDVDCAGA